MNGFLQRLTTFSVQVKKSNLHQESVTNTLLDRDRSNFNRVLNEQTHVVLKMKKIKTS
jgi:hypothetical protein